MAADGEPGNNEQQPEDQRRKQHAENLDWLLFLVSGMRFTRIVVRQAVHYAEQVLPTDEDDEGERACLAAALAWSLNTTTENLAAVERAANLITANAMESIPMVQAARYAVRAVMAGTPEEAAEEAAKAVEDAAGRKASRAEGDYMGRAVGRLAGLKIAQQWQEDMLWELTFDETVGEEILPFPPLPELPADPGEVIRLFKSIYSEEDAYRARDLDVLLDFMTPEQQLHFKQAAVSQAISYAEPLLPPPAEDQGERALLAGARRWVDQPTEENARASLLVQEVEYRTPSLYWSFLWNADTQPMPHATPSILYVARTVQAALHDVPHEARMAAAELGQRQARQWQAAAAAAIVQARVPPGLDDALNVATGARGAYLEGRLALLVAGMTPSQQLQFKQAVVRYAIEQAERVLPPEASDKGHRRCLATARRWLSEPTEENAKAAWAAAWVGTEDAPASPRAAPADAAAWLAARGTAEAAAQADPHKASLQANILGPVTMVLEGVPATSKKTTEATHRGKARHLEVAWRILQGEEPPPENDRDYLPGESFGTLVEGMGPAQLRAMAGALERQALWYGARAGSPAPDPWLERPDSGERSGATGSLGAEIRRSLEKQVEHALAAVASARTTGGETRIVGLREAAESVWKAASYAGERHAGEWQIEAARAILQGIELPAPDVGVVALPAPEAEAQGTGSTASEAAFVPLQAEVPPDTANGKEEGEHMAEPWKDDRLALQALLSEEPEAQARYGKLKDFEKEMCLQWIADAPTPLVRQQRVCRLARRFWLTSFNPYYDIGPDLMLAELDDLYGAPKPFEHLSPEEQALALEERRVLGASHTRNYDDAGTWFRAVPAGDRLGDDLLLAYARPCVLTENITGWLNRNGWETMRDVREWMDLPDENRPPAPLPEPLRIEDTTAGELRPDSERHTGPVLAVAVTPDGARAVSASADGTLRVWDAVKGQSIHVLAGHAGPVRAVALMPNGRVAVSGSDDGTLRLWDMDTGEPLRKLSGHEGSIAAVAALPGGDGVVSASADGAAAVWYFAPAPATVVLRDHEGPVLDVAVAPDGGRVVSASADGTLRVWDASAGQVQQVLRGHAGAVTKVAFTRDGERVVSASDDGTLRVWNPSTGRTRAIMLGHTAAVRTVLVPDDHRIISGSDDGTLRVWHIAGASSGTFAGHTGAVTGVAVAHQGWGDRFVWLSPGSLMLVQGMALPKGNLGVVSASADGTLRLWNLSAGRTVAVLAAGVPFTRCAMSLGGQTFVAGDEQGQVHFVQLRPD